MFIELTSKDAVGSTSRVLISISQIVSIWGDDSGTVSIFTTESDESFTVTESFDAIKFLLQMNIKALSETTTSN